MPSDTVRFDSNLGEICVGDGGDAGGHTVPSTTGANRDSAFDWRCVKTSYGGEWWRMGVP